MIRPAPWEPLDTPKMRWFEWSGTDDGRLVPPKDAWSGTDDGGRLVPPKEGDGPGPEKGDRPEKGDMTD